MLIVLNVSKSTLFVDFSVERLSLTHGGFEAVLGG